MKDPKRDLENKQQSVRVGLLVVGLSILVGLLLLTAPTLIYLFPDLISYNQPPYWSEGIMGLGIFIFTGALVGLRKVSQPQKRNKKLKRKNCDTVELEVLDRFTFIKLLPGEEENVEFRYFVKTAVGNWQLAADKRSFFSKLQPGTLIRAEVITRKKSRQILDLEILSGAKADTYSNPLNRVVDKVASEVKIISYRDGEFVVNKQHLLKELKYYLVVNNVLLPVTGTTFSQTKLNQKYFEGLQRATALQISVKDKYLYLCLPSGEDGPLTYNYFVVSTASTWRLGAHLKDLFHTLIPGALLQIAVVDNCIMDIDFLENSPPIPPKTLGMVIGKVISDVKITGYQNGRYSIKRAKPSYMPRHYLIVNNIPVEINEDDFTRTPYYAFFAGTKRQLVK